MPLILHLLATFGANQSLYKAKSVYLKLKLKWIRLEVCKTLLHSLWCSTSSYSISISCSSANRTTYIICLVPEDKINKRQQDQVHTLTSTLKIRHNVIHTPNPGLHTGLQGLEGLSILFWLFQEIFSYLKGLI